MVYLGGIHPRSMRLDAHGGLEGIEPVYCACLRGCEDYLFLLKPPG